MAEKTKERIYVHGHISHSKNGKIEHVKGFIEHRLEPYPRGKRLHIIIKHHPGYKASYPAKKNAEIGYRAAIARNESKPWLSVARELRYDGLLQKRTNPIASASFYAGARYAANKHLNSSKECDEKCYERGHE